MEVSISVDGVGVFSSSLAHLFVVRGFGCDGLRDSLRFENLVECCQAV